MLNPDFGVEIHNVPLANNGPGLPCNIVEGHTRHNGNQTLWIDLKDPWKFNSTLTWLVNRLLVEIYG